MPYGRNDAVNGSRLLLIVAAILFLAAAAAAGGALHVASVEVLALLGFAAWAGAGAV
jgi:hypothetical protein